MKKDNDTMAVAQAALAEKRAARQQGALVPASAGGGMTALQIVEHSPNIEKLGETFAASGFFGSKITKSMATAALVNCFVEGLSPIQYRAKYHMMEDGGTTLRSDYLQRNFRRLGGRWRFNEWTNEVCDMTLFYEGEETPAKVTLKEMMACGVAITKDGRLKTNWAKFPREMLKARCLATYIRAVCPEAAEGLYTQEEAMDFDAPSPTRPPAPAPEVRVTPSPIAPEKPVEPEVVEPEPVDFNVCPCGKVKGQRFEDIPTDILEKILEFKSAKITDGHRAAIVAVLQEREAEG